MFSLPNFFNKHFKILFFFLLILVGVFNFWDSFKNPFFIDDADHYLNVRKQNPQFFSYDFIPNLTDRVGFENFENRWGYYRPLTHFLFSIESSLLNSNSVAYQFVSLVSFVLACYSIFLFVFSITSSRFISSSSALLYLLHPFNGLAVNYKTAFHLSLQIVFFNLIFIYINKISKERGLFHWSQYLLYLVLFLFTLLFHELAFIFPLILLFYFLATITINRFRFFLCSGFFSVFLFYLYFRSKLSMTSGGLLGAVFGGFKITWYEACAAYARIIRWVITKLFYPDNIFLQWVTSVDKYMAGKWIWVFVFYLCVFLYFSVVFYRENKKMLFFWLMFSFGFVLSAPASYNILGQGFFYFEPHWIFYTNIGFFAIISWFIHKTKFLISWFPYVLLVLLSTFLFLFSYKQNLLFNNPASYYTQWVAETPGFDFPAIGYCSYLQNFSNIDNSINCFKSLLETQRKLFVFGNLGSLYVQKGDYKEAKFYYNKLLDADPTFLSAYLGLATISMLEGGKIKASDFNEIEVDVEALFEDLERFGYIDHEGNILNKFHKISSSEKINLSPQFSDKKEDIYAVIHRFQGDYKKALSYLDEAQKYDIFSIDIPIYKISILEEQKQYQKAIDVLDQVKENYFVHDVVELYKVRIYLRANNIEKAKQIATELISKSKSFELLIRLREILFFSAQYELADNAYKQAFLVDPKRALKLKMVLSK